jgi:N-acetylgalactosamine PTS system EIIA component
MSEESSPGEGVRAIVIGHGDFAVGIVSAVQQITGRGGAFVAMSGSGMSAGDLEGALEAALDQAVANVVFTDLPAGSSTMATRKLQRRRPGLVLVTGANLAVLLDFLFHEGIPASEAAQHAADKGKASVTVVGGAPGAN